jgi:hypothetical protein
MINREKEADSLSQSQQVRLLLHITTEFALTPTCCRRALSVF